MYRIEKSNDEIEQLFFDWMLVSMTVVCILLCIFALMITIPYFRKRLTARNNRRKKEDVRKFALDWVEKQRVMMKWLSLDKIEQLLKEVETKLEKEVAEVISKRVSMAGIPTSKLTKCSGLEKNTVKDVYPVSVLERIKNKKMSMNSVARTQMLLPTRQKKIINDIRTEALRIEEFFLLVLKIQMAWRRKRTRMIKGKKKTVHLKMMEEERRRLTSLEKERRIMKILEERKRKAELLAKSTPNNKTKQSNVKVSPSAASKSPPPDVRVSSPITGARTRLVAFDPSLFKIKTSPKRRRRKKMQNNNGW